MSTDEPGGSDPRRAIELLWDVPGPPRRGPKPKLTVAEVVTVAISLADADSLTAVSARRIADQLGVSPMSLYTYVPGRAELVELMIDRVHGELPAPDVSAGWRAALTGVAGQLWRMYHRHPWMLQVTTGRLPLGPNTFAKYDHELRAIDGLGLDDLELDAVASLVGAFVQGTARGSVDAARLITTSGLTDAQWWERSAEVLAEIPAAAAENYPLASRVGTAAGQTYGAALAPEHTFRFGLDRILDGLEVLFSQRKTDRGE